MKSKIFCFICLLIAALFISVPSWSQTTCEKKDCQIKITIKIAYVGATDAQVQSWTNEIEDTWNGDGQVTGDCNCPVSFEVETMKITDPAQANCNPGPAGYHCVMVTPYATNPPVDTTGKTYPAYMYPPGIARNGESLKGWWSDITNRPVDPNDPSKGIYHDASHEAGHIMGLDQNEGDGLMKVTWGENAKPTQGNIDSAVGYVCGADACPDRCCCGNGTIEADKGEGCDPFAEPVGCGTDEYCCIECCSCYAQICFAEDGEYNTAEECTAACTGKNSSCYQNYKTGCWDCVKYGKGEHKKVYTESFSIKRDEHLWYFSGGALMDLEGYDFGHIPELVDLLSGKTINLYVEGKGDFSIITVGTVVWKVSRRPLTYPLAMVFTDKDTMEDIANEWRTVEEALANGRIYINTWPFDDPPEPIFARPLNGVMVEGNVFIGVFEAHAAADIMETRFEVGGSPHLPMEEIGVDLDPVYGWGIEWNTDSPFYPNGLYLLKAIMTDFAGNEGEAEVIVEINNEPMPPPVP